MVFVFRLIVFLFMCFVLVFGLYGCCVVSIVKLLLVITCDFGWRGFLGGFGLIVWVTA